MEFEHYMVMMVTLVGLERDQYGVHALFRLNGLLVFSVYLSG